MIINFTKFQEVAVDQHYYFTMLKYKLFLLVFINAHHQMEEHFNY